MAEYPTNKIYIVKVKNKVYLAFLENRDGTRIKFFGSGDVIPENEVYNYIEKKYNRKPVWIRQVRGSDGRKKYCKNANSYTTHRDFYGTYWDKTPPPEYFDIAHDFPIFDYDRPSKPSDRLYEYEGDDEDLSNRILKRRMKKAFEEYEQKMTAYENARENFPSFAKNSYTSYTENDVCELMEWLESKDPEQEPESEKYYSTLDF